MLFKFAQSSVDKLLPFKFREQASSAIDKLESKLTEDSAAGRSAGAALTIFVLRLVGAALVFILQVFLARWMGATEFGIFTLVWVIATILGAVTCTGMQAAIVRFITEYIAKRDWPHIRGVILTAFAYPLIIATLIIGFGTAVLQSYPDIVSRIYVIPAFLTLICVPMLALEEIQEGIARSLDMPVIAMSSMFVIRPALIIVAMASMVYSGFEPTAVTAMYAAIIGTYLATIVQSIALFRSIGGALVKRMGKDNSPKRNLKISPGYWASVALPVFLSASFFHLLTTSDVLFVGYFLEPDKVAVYFAALKVLALVHFVHFAVRGASAHHFSDYYSRGDFTGLAQYANKMAQWSFWPTFVFALIMVIFGKLILMLFGEQFTQGWSLLAWLAAGIVCRSAIGAADSLLTMAGQQNTSVIVLSVALVSNVILNFSLIPLYGVEGAAIATLGSMLIESMALYVAVYRKLGIKVFVFAGPQNPQTAGSNP